MSEQIVTPETNRPENQECYRYLCPACGSDDLEVAISVWARLQQYGQGEYSTFTDEARNGDHEWDDNSGMACRTCDHGGNVDAFDNPDFEEGPGPCLTCGTQCDDEGICPNEASHVPC